MMWDGGGEEVDYRVDGLGNLYKTSIALMFFLYSI